MSKINQISVDGVVYDIATKKEVELEAKIDNKADKATTLDGYGITDAYTKDSVDGMLSQKNDILTFDTTPTADSTNPVTSGGVKVELDKKVDKEDGKGLSTNDYTTAEKSKVANLPDDTNTELSKKADKSVFFVGGFEGGLNASVESGGGAIGKNSKATSGGAIGENAKTTSGGSVGANSNSDTGGAIGTGAQTSNGFAGGYNAKTVNASGSRIDAVQLGTGTNSEEKTAQFYDYKIMKSDGNIPVERLTELKKLSVPHTTVSDYPISVSDHLEGERVIDYKVYGNSVQDGTPTPDTPIEIQSVGDLVTSGEHAGKYDVPVTVCGKNLIPYPYYETTITKNGITFTDNGDGTITANGTATATVYFYLENSDWNDEFPLSAGTYTLSGCPSGGTSTTYRISIGGRTSETGSRIVYGQDNGKGLTVTLNEGRYNPIITISSGVRVSNLVFKPQLEFGSTATPYEPYQAPITKHIYLDEPLYNLDYVDYGNGFFVNKIGVIDDFSNITFSYTSNSNYFQTTSISGFYADATLRTNSLCNYFKYGDAHSSDCFWIDSSGRGLRIKTDKYDGTTVAEFNEWIKSIPIKIYYPLATPTTEPITVPELTAPNSTVMNISSETATQPSQINLTYYQDINKVITNLTNAVLAQGGNV